MNERDKLLEPVWNDPAITEYPDKEKPKMEYLFKASNGWEILDIAKSYITDGTYLSVYNAKYPEDDIIFCVKETINPETKEEYMSCSLLLGPGNKTFIGPTLPEFLLDELVVTYKEAYANAAKTIKQTIQAVMQTLNKDIT